MHQSLPSFSELRVVIVSLENIYWQIWIYAGPFISLTSGLEYAYIQHEKVKKLN